MEQKRETTIFPDPGKCPSCSVSFFITENGYYCGQCGYMGWFTYDQWFND